MRIGLATVLASGWSLLAARCECARPMCESSLLLAQAPGSTRWLVLNITTDHEETANALEVARVSLEADADFQEAAAALAECYGWPIGVLDEDVAVATFVRMMEAPDAVNAELAHWGPEGVREMRRWAGESPASCEAALLCVRRARLDDGGGRLTAGPLAR